MSRKINRVVVNALILAILFVQVYPILFVVISSFKTSVEISMLPIYSLPRSFSFENYTNAIKLTKMGMLFQNTTIVTGTSVLITLILSAMASFGVTIMRWKGQRLVSSLLTLGMFIPSFVLLLPQFILLKNLGVLNTRMGLITIYCGGVALPIFLLNGFYRFLPSEVLEASVIDGCGIYRMFWHVVTPMSLNGYITVVLMIFFTIWNDLLISRTFTSSQSLRMLQNGLAAFSDQYGGRDWGATYAAVTLATLPTMLIYLVMNRKIIDGLVAGAVKG